MIAVDTNVIVRLLTNDDKSQAEAAVRLFKKHTIFISKTVLLETEWVLRYTYELSSEVILEAFERLLGLASVDMEDPGALLKAMYYYREGLDFEDALHLASGSKATEFATFDKKFAQRAKKLKADILLLD